MLWWSAEVVRLFSLTVIVHFCCIFCRVSKNKIYSQLEVLFGKLSTSENILSVPL